MISYMSHLMEDATDFGWQGAKAAHAVLCCELEHGTVTWTDSDRIYQIRRAHAQKHTTQNKGWSKSNENKRPWFCNFFPTGVMKLVANVNITCVYCLQQGKVAGRPEKECDFCDTMTKKTCSQLSIKYSGQL